MTRSIRKRNKQLRKQDKPQSPYAQKPGYWRREIRNRDKLKADIGPKAYHVRNLPKQLAKQIEESQMDPKHDHLNELLDD